MIPQCISLVGKADLSSSCHHLYILAAHLFSSPCPEPFILILHLCQYKGLSGSQVNQIGEIIYILNSYTNPTLTFWQTFLTQRRSLIRITKNTSKQTGVILGCLQAGWGEEQERAGNHLGQLYFQDKHL